MNSRTLKTEDFQRVEDGRCKKQRYALEMQLRWRKILLMMTENDVGATRSDGFAVIDGKALPAAGTSVQAREIWGGMVLLAVLDEMVGWN